MSYPPQPPQDPYGQQQPSGPYGQQQPPYGYSGPQTQYGYGQQPPGPPPRRNNTGMIVLLVVGLPLLLLGGCAAVVLVLTNTGQRPATAADPPALVVPSRQPESNTVPSTEPTEASEPTAEAQPSTAAVGGALTLAGIEPELKMTVTLAKVVNPASPAQDFMKPKAGNKFVAVQLTLTNAGQAVYSDSPSNGAQLIDGEGQQYRSTLYDVQEGPSFGGSATINTGDSRKGMIVFEVPESTQLAKFQFTLNSGFADQTGEWTLS